MGKFVASVKNGWLTDVTDSIMYLAFFVGDPAGAGVEISGGNYARLSVATAAWGTPSAGSVANVSDLTFPQATDIWSSSDVTYWALYDAATAGNLVASDELVAGQQQPIVLGNTVEFSTGDIVLSITDPT